MATLVDDGPEAHADSSTEDLLAAYRRQREARARALVEGADAQEDQGASSGAKIDARRLLEDDPPAAHGDAAPAPSPPPSSPSPPAPSPAPSSPPPLPAPSPAPRAPRADGRPADPVGGSAPDPPSGPTSDRDAAPPPAKETRRGQEAQDTLGPGGMQDASSQAASADAPLAGSAGPGLPVQDVAYSGPIDLQSMGLEEAVRQDPLMKTRGAPWAKRIGLGFVILGALLAIADRRLVQTDQANWFGTTDVLVLHAGASIVILGAIILIVGFTVPWAPRLAHPGFQDQGEAFAWTRGRLAATQMWAGIGIALVALAWLLGAYATVMLDALDATVPLAAGVLLGLSGAAMMLFAAARRRVLRALLMETLLLAAFEKAGLGVSGADERVGPVLRRLDSLLGSLPDEAIESFMTSPEAQDYLALLEETAESGARDEAPPEAPRAG